MSATPHSETPTQIAKYQIRRLLGSGSMGNVYLGHDPFINRPVALKVAHPNAHGADLGTTQATLFFNEAKAAGLLKHPNIVAILDAGVEGDTYYLVMEYVEGGNTLEDFAARDTLLPIGTAIRVFYQCALAIHYAHSHGVVHRDLKPTNILLTPDLDVKVSDFGIAFMPASSDAEVLRQQGSPLYMAPEQLGGQPPSPVSDLFALGVIIYELIAGSHPFSGKSLKEIQRGIRKDNPTPVSKRREGVPPVLDRVIARCLAKDPALRYRNAIDLAGDLSVVVDFVDAESVSSAEKFATARELPLFSNITDEELRELIAVCAWKQVSAGQVLTLDDDPDQAFYVVLKGQASITRDDQALGQLNAGDCFGAVGHAGEPPGPIMIAANLDTRCLKISSAMLERTSQSCQLHFHKIFLHTVIERLNRARATALKVEEAQDDIVH